MSHSERAHSSQRDNYPADLPLSTETRSEMQSVAPPDCARSKLCQQVVAVAFQYGEPLLQLRRVEQTLAYSKLDEVTNE